MHMIRQILVTLVIAVGCLLAAPPTLAQTDVSLEASEVESWLDGYLDYALTQANIAGAVVVIVDRDGVVLQKGYGLADVAAGTPVSATETLFRPGSISKLFTWTAVMQLVEQGQIDLDADVNAYLDFEIPPFEGQPITIRQIMTHQAGFEEALRYLFTAAPMPLEDYAKQALPARVFAPGTTPAYSNYASALAGYVVERVSGQPFNDYVDQNIFAPLGMENATFAQPLPARLKDQMSQGYGDARFAPLDFEIIAAGPAGGLSASGADMGRFMIAHLNDGRDLMRPETARAMHNYQAPGIAGLNRMTLGFFEKEVNGLRGIGHGGDTQAFHSDLTIFPDQGVGLYISLNSTGKGPAHFAIRQLLLEDFADRFLPTAEDGAIEPSADPETARAHIALVSGHYVGSRGSFTNFFSFLGLLSQNYVGAQPDGSLWFPMFDEMGMGPFDWVEVAPFVWQDRNSSHTIAAEVVDGEVTRISTDMMSPAMVLIPASAGQRAGIWVPLLGASVFVILLQALLWPVRAIVRCKYGAALALERGQLLAYRLTGVFAWGIVFAILGWVAFGVLISGDITLLSGPLDGLLNALRVLLPLFAVGLALASAVHFGVSFKGKRSWLAHIGRLLLLLAALVLIWIVFSFHLYGFGLQF